MSLILRILYSLWAYPVVVLSTVVFATWYLVTVLIRPSGGARIPNRWGRTTLFFLGPSTREGVAHLPDGPFAIFANHASFVDILALQSLPVELRFVAKRLFFQIPLLGRVLRHRGDVMMAKKAAGADQDRRAMVREIRESAGADTLANWKRDGKRQALVVFAEGTRSRDGVLKPFRTRNLARKIADAELPVVPVAIIGTFKLWPASSLLFSPARVRIVVTPPVCDDDPQALLDKAHAQVAAAMQR